MDEAAVKNKNHQIYLGKICRFSVLGRSPYKVTPRGVLRTFRTEYANNNRSTARRLLGSFDRSVREVVEHVSPEGPVGALASWVRQYRWSRRGPSLVPPWSLRGPFAVEFIPQMTGTTALPPRGPSVVPPPSSLCAI